MEGFFEVCSGSFSLGATMCKILFCSHLPSVALTPAVCFDFWFFFSPPSAGLKASLERLQLDYVDVVFANRPDPNTPMEGESSALFMTCHVALAKSQLVRGGQKFMRILYWSKSTDTCVKNKKKDSGKSKSSDASLLLFHVQLLNGS